MRPKTDGILESSLYVSDLPRSVRFYQETFGFSVIKEFGERGCAMNAGPRQVEHNDVPEGAVAYAEGVVRDLYRKHGLNLSEPIRFGKWCGRKNGLSWQDMIVAVRSH